MLSAMVAKVLHLTLLLGVVAVTSVIGQRNIALSGPEFRRLRLGQNPEFLQYAAMTLETVTIVIDGPEVLAVVQEDVNANFWCLPWLQRFPGGSIRWFFQRREVDTGELLQYVYADDHSDDNLHEVSYRVSCRRSCSRKYYFRDIWK